MSVIEKSEDTKRVIRSRKSKNKQCNDQKKKVKGTNNGLQNTTQITIIRATRTPLRSGVNSCATEGIIVPVPHVILIIHTVKHCTRFFLISNLAIAAI